MTARLLLALAVVAITARLLRRRHPAPLPEADDIEVVGMPTTWDDRTCFGNSWTLGYDSGYVIRHDLSGPYIETAPTSRN